jgi:hypothetical protein
MDALSRINLWNYALRKTTTDAAGPGNFSLDLCAPPSSKKMAADFRSHLDEFFAFSHFIGVAPLELCAVRLLQKLYTNDFYVFDRELHAIWERDVQLFYVLSTGF